jgi:protein-tyrosine phosphatase
MAAHEIVPGLWIGNRESSMDRDFLSKEKIISVFNCTKTLPFEPTIKRQFRVPLDDNLQAEEIRNMELWAMEIAYKITTELSAARAKGEAVLVHCHAGMQRSAGSVAIYLIATQGLTTDQAVALIKEKRPIAFKPAINFERAIRGFEATFEKEVRPRLVNLT